MELISKNHYAIFLEPVRLNSEGFKLVLLYTHNGEVLSPRPLEVAILTLIPNHTVFGQTERDDSLLDISFSVKLHGEGIVGTVHCRDGGLLMPPLFIRMTDHIVRYRVISLSVVETTKLVFHVILMRLSCVTTGKGIAVVMRVYFVY